MYSYILFDCHIYDPPIIDTSSDRIHRDFQKNLESPYAPVDEFYERVLERTVVLPAGYQRFKETLAVDELTVFRDEHPALVLFLKNLLKQF